MSAGRTIDGAMLIKRLKSCPEIVANDGCRLKELLHPDRDEVDLGYSLAIAWVDPGRRTHAGGYCDSRMDSSASQRV